MSDSARATGPPMNFSATIESRAFRIAPSWAPSSQVSRLSSFLRPAALPLLVLAVAAVVLTGCAASPASAPQVDATVATYESTGPGGDGAQLQGVLRVIEGGCVVVETESQGTITPVFPADEINDATGALFEYKGVTYYEGEQIDLGGGASQPSTNLPKACASLGDGFNVAAAG